MTHPALLTWYAAFDLKITFDISMRNTATAPKLIVKFAKINKFHF